MSEIFIEKAFWFVAALILSLVAVIYKLFNGSIDLKILHQRGNLREEIEKDLVKYFDTKLTNDISYLKGKFDELRRDLELVKTRDDNNSKLQVNLMNKILIKLSGKHNNMFEENIED